MFANVSLKRKAFIDFNKIFLHSKNLASGLLNSHVLVFLSVESEKESN